jgi:hypothetical protein
VSNLGHGLAGGAGLATDLLLDLAQVVPHQIKNLFYRQNSDDRLLLPDAILSEAKNLSE